MLDFKSSTSVQLRLLTPTCRVCLEPYDDKQHVPKILQCAHTVCESCIQRLEEQGRQMRPNHDPNQVTIPCPVCRTITQTSRCCIRTNYQLIDVVDMFTPGSTHNIAYINCTSCNMIYHEKDMNICLACSRINETTKAESLVRNGTSLHSYALCSTCLLNNHLSKGHKFIHLQPLRIEMQREENVRRLTGAQERLTEVQNRFREQLETTIHKWLVSGGSHEQNMLLFRAASSSFQQKLMFEKFNEEIDRRTEQIQKLAKHVQQWSDEMEKEMQQGRQQEHIPGGPFNTTATPSANPTAPETVDPTAPQFHQHMRADTPFHPPQPNDNMIYYFEEE